MLVLQMRRDFQGQGIGYVEMLFRCNIFALVGGGDNLKWAPSKVTACSAGLFSHWWSELK